MKLIRIFGNMIVTLSFFGLIANIMSISYFIKREKKGLPNKLMICLNFTDILTSLILINFNIVSQVFSVIEFETSNDVSVLLAIVTTVTFNTVVIISGCLTFVLTLLRTIVIYNPFYRIKQMLCVSCLVFIVVVLVALMQLLTFWTSVLPDVLKAIGKSALMVASLSCCNILMSVAATIMLKKSNTGDDGQEERNHAAVTMVIISVIYFITSFPVLITLLISGDGHQTKLYKSIIYVVISSLSGLFNPLVYIFRKRLLRRYIKEQFCKLTFCCRKF